MLPIDASTSASNSNSKSKSNSASSKTSPRASTKRLPKIMLIIAVTFFAGRLGVIGYEHLHPPVVSGAIRWQDPPQDEGKDLRAPKKVRLYWFTAQWCGPCKQLEETGFSNTETVALINDKFLPIKVVDRRKEDGKNSKVVQSLQKENNIYGFPTLVAKIPEGLTIDSQTAFLSNRSLLSFLKNALIKADFSSSMYYLRKNQANQVIPSMEKWLAATEWTDPDKLYGALYISIAYLDLQQKDKAKAILDKALTSIKSHDWPYDMLHYLDYPPEKLISIAENSDEKSDDETDRLVSAHFFSAIKLLANGTKEEARKHLLWVKDKGNETWNQYAIAMAKLKQLNAETTTSTAATNTATVGR